MILSGFNYISFLLDPTVTTRGGMMLRPRIDTTYSEHDDHRLGPVAGPSRYWTEKEIVAAARWWRGLADGREALDQRHIWFGGGIAFGHVTPMEGADVAIDVLVTSGPDAERPEIIYDHGHVEVCPRNGCDPDYITIDTSHEQVRRAARWWESLL